MSTFAFICGMVILGVLTLISAFVIAGAVTNAAGKSSGAQGFGEMNKPEMKYLTEYDAADYIGISYEDLDILRRQGLFDGVYSTLLTIDPDGTEEYEDVNPNTGAVVIRTRRAATDAVHYIYSRDLLDKRMNEIIESGKTLNCR